MAILQAKKCNKYYTKRVSTFYGYSSGLLYNMHKFLCYLG